MNKKAFTLIELLAVIVILAIISLIAVPIVINIINDSKKSSQEESIKLYGDAVKKAIANYQLTNKENKTISFKDLEESKLINYKGSKIECEVAQIWDNKDVYLAECTIDGELVDYTYGKLHVEKPELNNGLTPVVYVDESTEENPTSGYWKVPENDEEWYDYTKQKWANAVVLGEGQTKAPGEVVTVDGNNPDALMMLVWIPRFEYKIEGKYGKHLDGTNGTRDLPGEIKVNFIGKNITESTSGYRIHPAFTFGNQELSGIWIGKFKLSHKTKSLNSINCTKETCTEAQYLRVLPNVSSLSYNSVSSFWYGIKSIENTNLFGLKNIDIHMIKNRDWAAVAYLSQSRYGKYGNNNYTGPNKEIYQSKWTSTGYSNGTTSQFQTRSEGQCKYNSMLNLGEGKGQCGPGASTTGNIYGVYDMAGGGNEVVMGVYGDSEGIYSGYSISSNSGFRGKIWNNNGEIIDGLDLPDSKYYDVYFSHYYPACKNNDILVTCYGHGLSETEKWYEDYAYMVEDRMPWLVRGTGSNTTQSHGGIFRFSDDSGDTESFNRTRVIISKKE